MANRLTQHALEVLIIPTSNVRVTQSAVEVLVRLDLTAPVTQYGWTIITMPSQPSARSVDFAANNIVAVSQNPFTGQQQIQDWNGRYMTASIQMPPMSAAQAAAWVKFLIAAKTSSVFQLPFLLANLPPQGTVPGTYWRLASNSRKWSVSEAMIYGLQFDIREALGDIGFNLPPTTFTISGSITDASFANVTTDTGLSATTDASGNFTIAGAPSGSHVVTPTHPGTTFTPPSTSVTVTTGNQTGVNFTGSSTGTTDVANQLYQDMVGANEGHPHGVPSSYDFYTGPFVGMGNSPAGNRALEWWGALYVGPSGNPATNTLVNVRACALYVLSASTGTWSAHTFSLSAFSSDYLSEDWTVDFSTPVTMRSETDGSFSFSTVSGRVAHFYAPYPRIAIDSSDIGGVVAFCEARLILNNALGTDDRSSASFLLNCGADYYAGATGPGLDIDPAVGLGKFKFVTTSWRSFAMTTMSLAALTSNPPPVTLTGVSP